MLEFDYPPVPTWGVLAPAVAWILFVAAAIPLGLALKKSWRDPALRTAGLYALLVAVPSVVLLGEYVVRVLARAPCYAYAYSSHGAVFIGNVLGVRFAYKSFQAWDIDQGRIGFQALRGLYLLGWTMMAFVQLVMTAGV